MLLGQMQQLPPYHRMAFLAFFYFLQPVLLHLSPLVYSFCLLVSSCFLGCCPRAQHRQ